MMALLARSVTLSRAKGGLLSGSCYRFYSVPTSQQAYLEPSKASAPGISFISLNRPQAKNAISQQMLAELEEAVEKAGSDK